MYVREHLLNKTTVTEHQIASRIAKTIDPNTNDTTDDPLVQLRIRQKWKWVDNLIIHYKHEARLAGYKENILTIDSERQTYIIKCPLQS